MMTYRRHSLFVSALCLVLSSVWIGHSLNRSSLPLPPPAALESVNEADLRQHVEFLASDELGGRYAFGPSNLIAARYLASRLRSYGFRGGAQDGSFFQTFEMVSQQLNSNETFIEGKRDGATVRFRSGEDFGLIGSFAEADIQGELVLVPSSLLATQEGDGRLDVKGKIAVIPVDEVNFADVRPAELNRLRRSRLSQVRVIRDIIERAGEQGAVGVILLLKGRTARPRLPESSRSPSASPGRLVFPNEVGQQPSLPVIQAYGPLIAGIFEGSNIDPQSVFSPPTSQSLRPLGKPLRVRISVQGVRKATQNVIGILDGSDPQLKHEYVLFSAHYDHLESTETQIFNGADDDASGTSGILEIAQAFALGPPPRRSIIVIFHSGEEEGLLGSEYFVQHPTVPLESIVVDLNVDMIGRTRAPKDTNPADRELSDANTLYLIGSDRLSQELHQLSEQTNQDTVRMNLDYRYNREDHPLRLYYRSDHWNYAKNGIPVIFYFTGLHQDYHKPTDDVEKLDFEKMARITRLIFATGWRIANLDHRLKLDADSR